MNDDIVARLRVHAECPVRWRETDALCQAAADEIERLREYIKYREDRDAQGRANWEKIKPLLYPLGGKINDR
jgi:hypothetical protein